MSTRLIAVAHARPDNFAIHNLGVCTYEFALKNIKVLAKDADVTLKEWDTIEDNLAVFYREKFKGQHTITIGSRLRIAVRTGDKQDD